MDDILSTQMTIPDRPPRLLDRPRLRAPDGLPRITLACAPAGYGKTTLLAEWARHSGAATAWLSLDDGDNDPLHFMQHFIAAIQTCFPGFGQATAEGLANTQPPSVAGLMRTLINPLCRLPEPLCLVLDDLHMIHEPTVHDAIACLLEQRPPRLFLMLASRCELPFSLARLRGQGQLYEVRPDDLRFTGEETATFCNSLMQLDLPPAQLAMLESRTEGWIVGLQLAALSLHNNPDKAGFIRQFAGDDRHITDFLMEEVLRSRSPEMQDFLLQTSILERFSAPLCEAVTGAANARERLDDMERGNLFLVGLDHRRQWYRYHHLFASLLQSRLRAQHPEQLQELHRRASRAYAAQGAYAEAVQHAIAAGEFEQAAALMEEHSGDLFSLGRFVTALGWAWRLPPELLARHPRLSMTCAWGVLAMDNLPEVERHVRDATASLWPHREATPGTPERTRWGQLALIRACQCCLAGDLAGVRASVQEALASLPPGRVLHDAAMVTLAFSHYVQGDLTAAKPLFARCARITAANRNLMVPILAALGLGRTHFREGRPQQARLVYTQTLADCEALGWQELPAVGMMHLGLGELALEDGDLPEAERLLALGVEMTAAAFMQYVHAWGQVLLATTRVLAGQADGGLTPGQEGMLARYSGRFVVELPALSAELAGLWLLQGRHDRLEDWLEETRLPLDTLLPEREAEYRMLARVWLARGQAAEALALLERLVSLAEPRRLRLAMTDIRLAQAEALAVLGQTEAAASARRQADELGAAAGLKRRLAISTGGGRVGADASGLAVCGMVGDVFRLSRKEKQVARHLIRGATSQEIAERLFVSLSTIKTHTKNIYAKLGVNKRLQAVEVLMKLDLA